MTSLCPSRRSTCQDLQLFPSSSSSGSFCAADSGTVGGRAIACVDAAGSRDRRHRQGVDLRLEAVHKDLLEPGGHQAHTVDPPGRVHRQPRAVYKYWARLRRLPPLVVPVTMQLQFQQSFVVILQVPQLQFIDRVVDTSVDTETGLTMQTVQKTRDSMVQFWATTGLCSDSAENCGFHMCSALTRLDVPVIMQRRSLAVGGAADSAHRRSQRTSQLQQRRMRFQCGW